MQVQCFCVNKHPRFQKLPFFANLFLILFFCVLISGCGAGNHDSKTVLRFSFWGSGEELESIQTVVQQFEAAHPEIKIEAIHAPDNYFQKLHILVAGDLTPDVMMLNSLYLPVYADNGILKKLDSTEAKAVQKEFYPQAVKAMSWQNTPYAIPRDVSDLVVFYNADLLKRSGVALPKANWTLAEFEASAKKVCRPPNAAHPAGVFGVSFFEKPLFWLPFVWSFGGDLFASDFKTTHLSDAASVEGLQAYADWVNKLAIAPSKKQVGQQGMSQLFVDGHVAFLVSGRWTVPFLRKNAHFTWDVAPFPSVNGRSIVGIDASGYAISSKLDAQHEKAAWLFVQYLTSAKALRTLTEQGLIVPSRRDLAQSPSFLNGNLPPKNNRVFLDIIATGHPTHTPPNWDEVAEVLNTGLEPLWDGRQSAKESVEKLLPELREKLN